MKFKWMPAAWVVLAMSGCGGGGGGGEGGGDGDWLKFSPGTLSATAYEGDSTTVTVQATASQTVSNPFNVAIVDGAGVVTSQVELSASDASHYQAVLHLSTQLAAGSHDGQLQVRLCYDDATVCQQPVKGSPWQLAYHFTILSSTNLTPLSTLAGAGAWSTYQGNASHTGALSATVDASKFSRRWMYRHPGLAPVVDNGRVFTVGQEGGRWTLTALDEASGAVSWQADLGVLFRVNEPAVADGRVFVASTGHEDTYMWQFDAATGAQVAKVPMQSQWETYLAPTVFGTKVYTNSGTYGGLMGFDANGLTNGWFNGELPQYDFWTPAVNANGMYAFAGPYFYAFDPATGKTRWKLEDVGNVWSGYSMMGAPVLDGQGHAYMVQYGDWDTVGRKSRLLSVDLSGKAWRWEQQGNFFGDPAFANGLLYVINGKALEARKTDDGSLVWSWTSPEGIAVHDWSDTSQVVVVGNLAFVRAASNTYAIDLQTHQSVWSHPAVGKMAVSANGVLYISNPDSLIAVNLH